MLEKASESPAWLQYLINDLGEVGKSYRNGAAHAERVDRTQLNEFRELLIGKGGQGLLRRLTQLEQKLREMPTVPCQDFGRSRHKQ